METWKQGSPKSGYDGDAKLLLWLEKTQGGDRINTDHLGHFKISGGSKEFGG